MIPFDQLAALVCGDLDGAAADAVEEHLLACDECAALADRLAAIGRAVTPVLRGGQGRGIVTAATAARLRAAGVPIGEYRIAPGGSVRCRLAPGDVFNMVTFELPGGGAERIEGVLVGADGRELERLVDVPFDRVANTVTLIESRARLQSLPTTKLTFRLLAVAAGGARTASDYVLDHQASP